MPKTYFEELKPKEDNLILELLPVGSEDKKKDEEKQKETNLEDTQPLSRVEIAKNIFYSKCKVGLSITGLSDAETFKKTIPFLSAKHQLETMFGVEFSKKIIDDFFEENKDSFIEIE